MTFLDSSARPGRLDEHVFIDLPTLQVSTTCANSSRLPVSWLTLTDLYDEASGLSFLDSLFAEYLGAEYRVLVALESGHHSWPLLG